MLRQASTSVIVGRRAELAAVCDALYACLSGSPHWVLLSGEAGLGKSRLLAEFAASVASGSSSAPVVVTGQCVDLGAAGVPFAPFRQMIRDLERAFGIDAVTAAAGRGFPQLAGITQGLARAEPGNADELREAFGALLKGLSELRPVFMVVEDAHWADAATLTILRGLAQLLLEGRITVLVTYRTEELGGDSALSRLLGDIGRKSTATLIALERLSREEVATQARRLLGGRAAPVLLRRIIDRSEGVPLFVEELAVFDGGARGLPDSLRHLMLARYAKLSPATRGALRLIATGGMGVEHEVVAQVFDGDPFELDESAREAVEASVLVRDEERYVFRHAFLREAVQSELMPGERARYNARYAQVLEQDAQGRWAEICHHWLAAHDVSRGFASAIAAMSEAAGSAPASAAELGRLATQLWSRVPGAARIAGTDRVGLLRSVYDSCELAGDHDGGLAVLEEALNLLPEQELGRRADLLHCRSITEQALGDPAWEETLAEWMRITPDPVDNDSHLKHAEGVASLSLAAYYRGDYAQAQVSAASAEAEALAAGGPEQAARALTFKGLILATMGDFAGADAAFDRVGMLDSSPLAAARLALHAGGVHTWLCGDHQRALMSAAPALDLAAKVGVLRAYAPMVLITVVDAQLGLGDAAAAAEAVEQGMRLEPNAPDETHLLIDLHRIYLWRDELVAAESVGQELSPRVDRFARANRTLGPQFAATSAQLALARADPTTAWSC